MLLGAALAVCHAALIGIGALVSAGGTPDGRPALIVALSGPLARMDTLGVERLTGRFEPALAPGLHAALGPQPPFYLALLVFVISAALLGRWRTAPRTTLATGLSVLVALELWAVGALLFDRPAPLTLDAALPVPEDWRAVWQEGGAFPSRHALVAAALAGCALFAWAPLGLTAVVLALSGAATAVYFGAAHVTDATIGVVLGGGAALVGHLGAGLARNGRLR